MDTEKEERRNMTEEEREEKEFQELLPLLRLLLKEPPEGHDFTTCEICRRWEITSI